MAARGHCADVDHRLPQANRARRRRILRPGQGAGPRVPAVSAIVAPAFVNCDPAIVHTRNLAALEMVVPAWAAGVPVRVHGEHGRDVNDLDGSRRRYQWARRLYRPFVTRYIALSHDLPPLPDRARGDTASMVEEICNGVDAERFRPAAGAREPIDGCPFRDPGLWLIGPWAACSRSRIRRIWCARSCARSSAIPRSAPACVWCWSATARCWRTRARC